MKLALAFAALLAVAAPARAAGIAFYSPTKAAAECAEGKKNAEAQKADVAAKNAKLQQVQTAAKSQKDKDAATALGQRLQQEFDQRRQADADQLGQRIDRVAAALRKARKLDALLAVYPGSDLAPGVDLTAEVVRRLDAGDGKTDDQRLAEAEKRAADAEARAKAAEARLAASAKDAATAPPPAVAVKK